MASEMTVGGARRAIRLSAPAILLAGLALLAGCGDGTEAPAEPASETPAPVVEVPPPPIEPPPVPEAAPVAEPEPAPVPTPEPAPVEAPPIAGLPAPEPTPPPAESEVPAIPAPAVEPDPVPIPAAEPPAPEPAPVVEAPALALEEPPLSDEMLAMIAAGDPVAGRTYAARCASCHALDRGGLAPGAAQVGPPLYGIFGAQIGGREGFAYSPVFVAMGETGATWTAARLNAFLADPGGTAPGTAMPIDGIASDRDRANVIAFLRILADAPLPLTGDAVAAPEVGDAALLARIAAADVAAGRSLAGRCSGCHRFGENDPPLTGPNLYGVVGAAVGGQAGFGYSPALRALNEEGATWTYALLDAFLAGPASAIPGNRMGFTGITDGDDRAAIIAYLRTLAVEPFPLAVPEPVEIGIARPGLGAITIAAEQVQAGGALYNRHCADCHRTDLRGMVNLADDGFGVAPPLTGPNFETNWYGGPVAALFDYIRTMMPLGAPGTLDDQAYADIVAYLLARNGFAPGGTPLPADAEALGHIGFFQQ